MRNLQRIRRATTASVALAVAITLSIPGTAHASVSPTPDATDRAFGKIYALGQVGDKTIIGGEFTAAGGKTRYNVALIGPDGRVDPTFKPVVNGPVYAVAGSADGSKVFVGGVFTSAGGAARANLAALPRPPAPRSRAGPRTPRVTSPTSGASTSTRTACTSAVATSASTAPPGSGWPPSTRRPGTSSPRSTPPPTAHCARSSCPPMGPRSTPGVCSA